MTGHAFQATMLLSNPVSPGTRVYTQPCEFSAHQSFQPHVLLVSRLHASNSFVSGTPFPCTRVSTQARPPPSEGAGLQLSWATAAAAGACRAAGRGPGVLARASRAGGDGGASGRGIAAGVGAVPAVAVMTDETVPEGHQGLHGFLYGESGADVHDGEEEKYAYRGGEDDGSTLMPLSYFEADRDGHKLAGVYAVYDDQKQLQYVGYSRNILLSLKAHRSHSATAPLCAWVRVRVFRDPAMVTRARLEEERQRWMGELCNASVALPPPGNAQGAESPWEGQSAGASAGGGGAGVVVAMSEKEREEYEQKKLKLRKAMGENLHDDVEGENMDSRQRCLALLQAVEGDNWSSVIDQQTQRTVAAPPQSNGAAAAAAASGGAASSPPVAASPIESPFAAAGAAGSQSLKEGEEEEEGEEELPMTLASVDMVLNAVRPYLIRDGGNVEVVSVDADTGVVLLQLQGACGTCPSSTVTMKMGIERVLREKFGSRLTDVQQVGGALGAPGAPTVQLVDAHLDMLRPAIRNFNGSVEVLRVDSEAGVCEVKYSGPAPVGMGIQAAIRDKFPTLTIVTLISP